MVSDALPLLAYKVCVSFVVLKLPFAPLIFPLELRLPTDVAPAAFNVPVTFTLPLK